MSTDVRRLFDAMNRRDHVAIYAALFRECVGCSHPEHEPGECPRKPLYTQEPRCRCHFGRAA